MLTAMLLIGGRCAQEGSRTIFRGLPGAYILIEIKQRLIGGYSVLSAGCANNPLMALGKVPEESLSDQAIAAHNQKPPAIHFLPQQTAMR
jgi:hypothetical protein